MKSTSQARYCADMMERIAMRVRYRNDTLRKMGGEYPICGSGMPPMETTENITRMIRQLRAELLELEGYVRHNN